MQTSKLTECCQVTNRTRLVTSLVITHFGRNAQDI